MALIALENFTSLYTGASAGLGKFGNLPPASASGYAGVAVNYNGKKWLWYNATTSAYLRLSLSGLISAGTSKLIFGFRLYRTTTAAATFGVFGLNTTLQPTYTFAANQQEVYFEVVVDRSGLNSGGRPLVDLYADGAFVSRYTGYAASLLAGIQAGTSDFFIVAGLSTRITDFYVVEDTNDDTPCDRLGPQNIVSINLETSSNVGWNVSALADALSREMAATDSGTRIVSTDVDAELRLKPAASYSLADPVSRVNGVLLRALSAFVSVGDIQAGIIRPTRSVDKLTSPKSYTVSTDPSNVFKLDPSMDEADYRPATALNGLEFSLKVVDRP